MAEPYRELVELAERELALVTEGDVEQLEALAAHRVHLVAGLPATPPPEAKPLLEHAAALQAQVTAALEASTRSAREELGRLRGGRTAVRVYSPAAGAPTRTVDRAG